MHDQPLTIRPFCEADWPAIWAMLRDAAAEGRAFTYPPALDEPTARAIWLPGAPGIAVVATDEDGAVAGSAKIGPNQMGPGAHVATASYLVDPRQRRRGAGRALGLWSIDWARRQGFAAMQFNAVVETNAPAVALWQSLGFAVVGRVPEAFQLTPGSRVALLVMHRYL